MGKVPLQILSFRVKLHCVPRTILGRQVAVRFLKGKVLQGFTFFSRIPWTFFFFSNYDDRTGVYKLVSIDISKTDIVSVLSYKAGDNLCFRNTADPTKDYDLLNGFKYYMSTFLYKRPSDLPFDANVNDGNTEEPGVRWESFIQGVKMTNL